MNAFVARNQGGGDDKVFDRAVDKDCSAYMIRNDAAATADLLVRVTPMHGAAEYVPIQPGDYLIFRARWTTIQTIHCKGVNSIASGGVVEI